MGIPKISIVKAIELLKVVSARINKTGKQGIFLWGPPGIGKSDLVRELARQTQRQFIDIRLSTIDPVDLRGLPQVDQQLNQTKWVPPDFLPQENETTGILFLDEINAAPPSVQAAAYQLILDRRLGSYVVPEDWLVIAAGNRLSDRSVTFRLPSALANRFSHFEIIVSHEEWYDWAWNNSIDPYIISFLKYQPQLLLQFDPNNPEIAFPTPRSWAFVSSFQDLRDKDIQLYYKGIHGTVGPAAGQQFLAFLKYRDVLPDPEIVLNGGKYLPPEKPDAQFVMMASLINALLLKPSPVRIEGYFKYLNYYQDTSFADYAIIMVKELLQAFQHLDKGMEEKNMRKMITSHPSYKAWTKENHSIFQ